jgi:hypothetical protein
VGGYPFLGQEEKRISVNDIKLGLLILLGLLWQKNAQKSLKQSIGPIFGTLYLFFAFFPISAFFGTFLVISLLFKVSDERVGGSLFIGQKGDGPPTPLILTCFELCAQLLLFLEYAVCSELNPVPELDVRNKPVHVDVAKVL